VEILGMFFEDFPVGKSGGSVGKTITSSDIDFFEEMSSWPRYSDAERQLAPEMLVTMISAGLMTRQGIYEGTLVGIIGNSWHYKAPVLVGDTLKLKYLVTEASLTKSRERGIVVLKIRTFNQRNETVAEGEIRTMIRARGE